LVKIEIIDDNSENMIPGNQQWGTPEKPVQWKLHHEDGRTTIVENVKEWANSNGYVPSGISAVYNGSRPNHKDIICVEQV